MNYPTRDMTDLFEAVNSLRSTKEISNFFRDLLTIKEIDEAAKRWKIARLLEQGIPYLSIAKTVGVSTTTVTRVALWLNHGQDGYKTALSRLKK